MDNEQQENYEEQQETQEIESHYEEQQEAQDDSQEQYIEEAQQEENQVQHEVKQEADEKVLAKQAIDKQHKKFRDEERAHAETKRRLDELESKLNQQQPVSMEIPPIPDAFDDDYEERVAERDRIIAQKAQYDAQQLVLTQQQQQLEYERRIKAQAETQKRVASYTENAVKNGISQDELRDAGNLVSSYNINPEIEQELLDDPLGPLVVKYLASNELELDELSRMPPTKAILYIERNIKGKLDSVKPRQSNAPKPPTKIKGNGVDPEAGKYRHIGGATFE